MTDSTLEEEYEAYQTVKAEEPLTRKALADRQFVLALMAVQQLDGDDVDVLAIQRIWQQFDSSNVTLQELSTAMRFHKVGVEVKQVHISQTFLNRLARWQYEANQSD